MYDPYRVTYQSHSPHKGKAFHHVELRVSRVGHQRVTHHWRRCHSFRFLTDAQNFIDGSQMFLTISQKRLVMDLYMNGNQNNTNYNRRTTDALTLYQLATFNPRTRRLALTRTGARIAHAFWLKKLGLTYGHRRDFK